MQKSLGLAQSPNIDIGQAALSCLDFFLTYGEYLYYYTYLYYYLTNVDDLRATVDTLEFMHIVMTMLHSSHVQCHPAIYQTFLIFAAYGVVDFIIIIS